jgi:hypothetical protein
MKAVKLLAFLSISLLSLTGKAQTEVADTAIIDSLYREDQIYFGFTYNIVTGNPGNIRSSQFSGGLHLGFIRDFPINERRNIAIGTGLGWSIDTYGQNLFIGEFPETGVTRFEVLDQDRVDFSANRFTTQTIDLPLQFRWRSSTPESYKFWRVYAGLRPAYVYYFKSKFVQSGNTIVQTKVPELERLRLGATFTFGYNTFNFHFYYSLNSFFEKEAVVNDRALELRTFQIGLMFYLL